MVYIRLFSQEEPHHSVKDTLSHILNAEDAEEWVSTSKITDVLHADSQQLRLEAMDGLPRLNKEEDKELEEWDTLKQSQESIKTFLRTRLLDQYLNERNYWFDQ
jgi:uncharacterized damage-inducible protein DinB